MNHQWSVLYGGFSRASGHRLVETIAIAVAGREHERWIVELARRIEQEASS